MTNPPHTSSHRPAVWRGLLHTIALCICVILLPGCLPPTPPPAKTANVKVIPDPREKRKPSPDPNEKRDPPPDPHEKQPTGDPVGSTHPFQTVEDTTGTTVMLHGVPVVTISSAAGNMSAKKRATIIANRLSDILKNDITHENVPITNLYDAVEKADPIIFFGYYKPENKSVEGDLIVTIDPKTASLCHCDSRRKVACWWRDVIRDWLMIGLGKSPQYTNDYAMKAFYSSMKLSKGRIPEQSDYDLAQKTLINHDFDAYAHLRYLFRAIPAGYQANASTIVDPKVTSDADKG